MTRDLRGDMRDLIDREVMARAKVWGEPDRALAPVPGARSSPGAASPVDSLEQDVLHLAADALRMPAEQIDPEENLANYGIDSIAITEVMAAISRFFGVSIAPTTFFEARHLKDLSRILRSRYGAAIDAHYATQDAAKAEISKPIEVAPDAAPRRARHGEVRHDVQPAPAARRTQSTAAEPVAIIGMEGTFPKSPDLAAFEAHLAAGDDCIEEIPPERWDWRAVDGDPKRGAFSNVRHGGFVPGHDLFDAAFFKIPPNEAELMDPQHRLFLTCVWKLIEGAGHAPGSLAGRKVGLFLGINLQDYADLANRMGAIDPAQLTGLGHAFCANRLSFLLDIHGPSQVIDTACSSSLVALHRAVQCIRYEGCEMAVAGGANLMLTPTQHILFSRVGMLAPDGRCKTFSRAANGYARAEGVGAVLLKRLDLAERDGDCILGVVRGSAENHGGAASSLTAPNPRAQARLIVEAHQQANIDPRSVGTIECHGTGTALGDPVEVEGLKAAFAELYAEHGLSMREASCGLGSVKSNIGHAETAAGIAGVIKVLLGFRAGRLWQSLHCEDPNPLIDLRGTPFYLMDAARDWPRPVIDGRELPRRAGVSSFGAGGANAHVVIEEYPSAPREPGNGDPQLIPLSARSEGALRDAAARLAAYLASDPADAQDLADIAFTLQTGRDEMRVRLACVAHDRAKLRARLEAFAEHGAAAGIVTGTAARKGSQRGELPDVIPAELGDDLARLAGKWVAGGVVAWEALHGGQARRRVRLPTYPFQGKRYWLPNVGAAGSETSIPASARSDVGRGNLGLTETTLGRFKLQLSPDAHYLRDHVIGGVPTLPGVVYLELMRRAVQAAGLDGALGQIVWLKPLQVMHSVEIEVAIDLEMRPRPRIEVAQIEADGTRHVHAEARLLPLSENPEPREISSDREATHPRRYDADRVYAIFEGMGLAYGPSHRSIVSLDCGHDEHGNSHVRGRLHLPLSAGSVADFMLHPSLMDGAFQCALGMALDESGAGFEGAALPFALDRIDVFAPCTPEMAVAVRSSDVGVRARRVQKLDIDLMDVDDRVCIRMSGFATRSMVRHEPEKIARETRETLLFAPDWQPFRREESEGSTSAGRRDVLLCGWPAAFSEAVAAALPGWSCRGFEIDRAARDGGVTACAGALLAHVQGLSRAGGSALLRVVIPDDAPWLAALSGLLKSAELEIPSLACGLLTADATQRPDDLAGQIEVLSRGRGFHNVRGQSGGFQTSLWRERARPVVPSRHPWRDGGVYLITGGAGGLGRLFACEISERADDVTLVLASRRAAAGAPSEFDSARVEHVALDVTDAASVAALVAGIRARHGRLDGVLHAAGLLDDGGVNGKSTESFRAVLAPKVAGTCHLDRALGAEPLDFMLLFGSLSGALGNPGQTDYATANAFLDAFASEREARRKAGLCHGRTLAVDWPVWRDGGMRLTPEAEKLMTRTTGLTPLETEDAFAALYDALASGEPQVMVAAGDRERIKDRLRVASHNHEPAVVPENGETTVVDTADLERAILPALMQIVSAQLKVALDDLAPDLELTEYGYDSISFTQLANLLNDRFGLVLTPTVFFEHATLGELASFFARDHGAAFASALGVAARAAPVARASTMQRPKRVGAAPAPVSPRSVERDTAGRAPIAIVGMSGVFPGAADPDALWQSLLAGRDATRDAPGDRWDRQPRGAPVRGGFIDGIGEFDAAFFGLSAPEARLIDPQQRLLLTQTWRLLEHAGYAPRALSGANIGVFVGIADTGYGRLVAEAGGPTEGYAMTGLAPSVGPNRVSFHFNFTGPSVAIETACSSALVAIHRAAEAIHSGDCEAAIAGGVNALLSPETFEGFARAGMLAADGRCKTFSAHADGYGRGEGIGLVFLKPLADAERDGDHILAVLRASAENHGGRASSLTAPNPKAQAALLKQAYTRAGFDPRTVTYIEAHGTGTPLGDPIEVEALGAAFAALSDEAETRFGPAPRMSCGIGSVKSNIGHLEMAAGAAGLIKVLLMMQAGTLARSLNCEALNPYLKLDDGVFRVVRETEAWARPRDAEGRELPRRAGVSSFGFGGSNAHLVLEEYVADAKTPAVKQSGPCAIVLSARSEPQLAESARLLLASLERFVDADLADIAFTLQVCRDSMEHRLAFPASSLSDIRRGLAAFLAAEMDGDVRTGRVRAGRAMLGLLDSDVEVRRALRGLPERGRQDLLIDLWVNGFAFDWSSLYGSERPRRVTLPGYPFARMVHWVRGGAARDELSRPAASETVRPLLAAEPALAAPPQTTSPDSGMATAPAMLERLTRIAARLLETDVDVLEPDTELGEFGFDSITMTTFAMKVNDELGLSLSPADFFEFATLARLADHIASLGPRHEAHETRAAQRLAATPEDFELHPVSAARLAPSPDDDPVVIVGVSCCFPGAADATAFWENLAAGVGSIREIPPDRWDWRALHGDPKTEDGKTDIRFGGFIDGVFEFDPLFFSISPREALLMDPQQRLMLMHAWKALEDAGHDPRSLSGRAVGLFVGTASSGYSDGLSEDDIRAQSYTATGSASSIGPNRISFFFDWHGPSEPVETACSSSLVALHRAVQAMNAGECDLAIAGGVNTIVTPEAHINFAKAGMLSRDGACHTFSNKANGYVRGEGAGIVVLKRRSEALRDGDSIYAVVRGTAVNHGGRANSLTAPNTRAQADVISRAYLRAGVDPSTVGYVEAHGTGTPLGDPVEINALKQAFGARDGRGERCGLGSVKTNIGHLELAAGIAGVIKVVMQLRHRTLAPSLNSEPSNPYIDLTGSSFFIVQERQPWHAMRDGEGREVPRRAGVSSFGFGGVNAHVVLEEHVDLRSAGFDGDGLAVVPLSARDVPRLADQARQLRDHLAKHSAGEIALADLAFTLQAGRTPLACRAAFVVGSIEALRIELDRYLVLESPVAHGAASNAAGMELAPDATLQDIAAYWAAGGEIDWSRLHPTPRRRLHLPTYPFAREVYKGGRLREANTKAPVHAGARPLQQAPSPPASALERDPDAFYFSDHRVAGAPMLPGVMTIELARAASGRSLPLSLGDVVWLKPMSAVAGASARIAFDAELQAFRLLTGSGDRESLHAQGKLRAATESAGPLEFQAIRGRCQRSRTADWLYAAFQKLGMEYGPAFRSVTELACGGDEVLARLGLPEAAARAGGDFTLHPSVMDGALQASLALYAEQKNGGAAVPFALDRVDILRPTTREMWAHIRRRPASGSIQKIDIDLSDDSGAICVRLTGFSVRLLPGSDRPRESTDALRNAAARFFADAVAAETAIPASQIELSVSLDAYGIDSFMIVRLTDELEKTFGPLSKTLFFEHRTLQAVVDYFVDNHADRLAEVTRTNAVSVPARSSGSNPRQPRGIGAADLDAPIAVVGLAGRYPGARDLDGFWDNLVAGRDCITEIPLERWDRSHVPGVEESRGWGGFIDGIAEFDPLFFNISPREAPFMDPQERLFLQCAHEAIEDSGNTRSGLGRGGDVGVFVGVMWEEYQLYGAERTAAGEPLALSSSPASIANRVSSVCDFQGPSLTVDSMCSSSLSAIHLACESLRLGTCAAAVAGGVNLSLHPNKYRMLAQGRFIASSGRCESFGAGGDGYVPSEGVGAAVLKRLDRAIADGDQIYGVIRGSALNHGGKTNGYTVPNPQAQTAVIRRALEKAGVAPRDISYVEAHGTGTKLGDPIEIAALSAAYRAETEDTGFCRIGSVKSNIGHCESAAGIAGLTKVLLQMRHQRLVPSLHADVLNPGIDFASSPFVVQRKNEAWERSAGGGSRLAGLSSFGAGGSNAHVILEAYEAPQSVSTHVGPFVFPFSARDEGVLTHVLRRFLAALDGLGDADLASAAFVLQQGREAFERRVAIVAEDRVALRDRLREAVSGEALHVYKGHWRRGAGVTTVVDHGAPDGIARAWVDGAVVDWSRCWQGSPPRKISLPTYPFAREIYWVPGLAPPIAPNSEALPAPVKAPDVPLPLLLTPDWQLHATATPHVGDPPARRIVVFCGVAPLSVSSAEIHTVDAPSVDRFGHTAEHVLRLIQSLITARSGPMLLQVVVGRDSGGDCLEGIGGLLRTAMYEAPGLRCQLIAADAASHETLAARIETDARGSDTDIRYEDGTRRVRRWREVASAAPASPWKDGGVYLITGGTGGLGLLLAERIAGSVRRPMLWLTSRTAPSRETQTRLDALDATVVHRCVDVANASAVTALVANIREAAGRLDGIVHAAGITRDKRLVHKSARELCDVLAPKVAGLAALDAASADCDLDVMLLFASASGALGNAGQGDYAAANAYMDAFAEQRNALVALGRRGGHTLAVDWPYWRDGGMAMPQAAIDAMERVSGARPLETDAAFAALDAAVAAARTNGLSQVLVLDGNRERLRAALVESASARNSPVTQPPVDEVLGAAAVQSYLAARIAAALGIAVQKLDVHESFDRYGLDSVSGLQIVDELEKSLGVLPKTLLFEYPTLAKLTAALLETHSTALSALVGEPSRFDGLPTRVVSPSPLAPSAKAASDADIAIIAVAGRYPGAETPEALWEALSAGRDLVTEVPPDRWDIDEIYAVGRGVPGKSCCRWGGFLADVARFDAGFFGLSPREARRMDPQERLLLETAWHALERAGYPPRRVREEHGGRVGVFVGSMSQQYRAFGSDPADRAALMLASQGSLANRMSHAFDFNGPSVAVDSMCSSGLEAIHLACQALRRGECRMAIAGAVNLTLHPDKYVALSEAGLIGSHRGSRAFAGGDGYIPAEGVGAVLLKPLAAARADRDNVLAVIKGSAVNHSGRSAGYGVPSAEAQCQLIEDNFRATGIDPRTVGCVEVAASGSALGDAIEVRALTRAFRSFTVETAFCALGSVKANMGHAEAASGFAQLTKCLFQLQDRMLAPFPIADVDPDLPIDGSPFRLVRAGTPWTRMAPDQPLRAAISSFGAGGTNVHLILEEAPDAPPMEDRRVSGPWCFILSAATEERLAAVVADMASYLSAHPDVPLGRLAWTLDVCRERLPCAIEISASGHRELCDKLAAWRDGAREFVNALDLPPGHSVHGAGPPLRLPDYPFQPARHWITPAIVPPSQIDTGVRDEAQPSQTLPRRLVLETLAEQTGLDVTSIPSSAAFRDLGASSMFALRLIRRCADELGVSLTHRELAAHDSVDALTGLIEGRFGDFIRAPTAVEAETLLNDNETGLSEGQRGLWVLQTLHPEMSTYNVPLAFRVARADPVALKRAFAAVLTNYPILGRRVEIVEGEARVAVTPESVPMQAVVMPRDVDEGDFLRARVARPFDLSSGPPIRFELIRSAERPDPAIVLFVVHHIAIDGLSATLLARAFWDAYACFVEGRELLPSPKTTDFLEFVAFERAHLASVQGKAQLAFWTERLADAPSVLDLPSDRTGDPTRPVTRSASVERVIGADLASAAGVTARSLGANRPAFFLSALGILLHRYTGQEDIAVGMPVMGRPARRFEESVGCFANMIVVRTMVSGAMSAGEVIAEVQARLTEGLDHADIPFAAVARALGRTPQDGPLYQVSFAYQNFFAAQSVGGVAEPITSLRQEGGDALGLEIFEDGDLLRVVANYDAARFDASRIARMLEHYLTLVEAMARAPDTHVSALDMLSEAERVLLLGCFATGGPLADAEGDVPSLVAAAATRRPDATALVVGARSLSFRELLERAECLAGHLTGRGVTAGDPVAVLMERGADAIIALLGVLSIGAVYVPLDGAQPDARLAAMLADARAGAIVVDAKNADRLRRAKISVPVILDADRQQATARKPLGANRPVLDPQSAAYIIFTSGSTGRPKGVSVSHRALAHHCQAMIERFGLDEQDRVLQFSVLSVDPALEQILPALMCGATVVMRDGSLWSPSQLRKVVDRQRVTVADLPPGYLAEVLAAWDKSGEAPKHTPRLLICGGDILAPETIRLWRGSRLAAARLINAYGPTETTITATTHEVGPEDTGAVPIGRPLAGTDVYVLDAYGNPVPEGVPGELYIGGSRVAIGYVADVETTRARFVENPFGAGRLYRTGDRVAFLPGRDGCLAFLGRFDRQVKIRGFRIELGEIDAALAACSGGPAATALSDGTLTGFVVLDEAQFDAERLAADMAAIVPTAMCPQFYVRLDAIPTTPAGKIDRAALAILARSSRAVVGASGSFASPVGAVEDRVAGLWREVLGISAERLPIGRDSDFFACGGHSLLAVRLLSAIERTFGRRLSMADLLAAPTVAAQARRLAVRDIEAPASGEPTVVLLRPGTGAPLFLMHPVGGGVSRYLSLAQRLAIPGPIYGVEAPEQNSDGALPSVSERAARYLAAVRAIQPHGPYRLAGWSFGGIMAFDMARGLLAAGEEVAYLGLIDSYAPALLAAIDGDTGDSTADMLVIFARDMAGAADIKTLSDGGALATVEDLYRVPELDGVLDGIDEARLRGRFETFRAHVLMARDYRPEPCAVSASLYLAKTGHPNRSRGWGALARSGLSVREIPGDHYSILADPALERLVVEMSRDLGACEDDTSVRPRPEKKRGSRRG